ncbi:MAG: magnesium transporter CorA family protein [Hyphomicrobiaceae bacterium]|nr:magnesium transporter CorA family protein [Hyphomicrobiaceae bacterium]
MLTIYTAADTCLACTSTIEGSTGAPAVWFDLIDPTPEEDREVERRLGVAVPTREEMQEIEASSRLYVEDGALYMTAALTARADTERPVIAPVTFILANDVLATVRYETPRAIAAIAQRALKPGFGHLSGISVLMALIESIIDRAADVLERVSAELDEVSHRVFQANDSVAGRADSGVYDRALKAIGRSGGLVSKEEETLVSLQRMISFLLNAGSAAKLGKDDRERLKEMHRDIRSIAEFATSLDNRLVFMLDATLGLVSLQQNNIVKIFSILAVLFMPPTLIASIYGMNFEIMPELKWTHGYGFALALMLGAAAATYLVFRWRKWL